MPQYSFSNPQNDLDVVSIVMSVNDVHEYYKNGVKWNRVWTIPQASIDSRIDPNSAKDFSNKTANKRGTVGDLWDKSAELSSKRAEKEGIDPIKSSFYENYSKQNKGRLHMDQIKEKREKTVVVDLPKKKVTFE